MRQHLGDRPVVAMIYTHSHVDHCGGVRGVIYQEDVAVGKVQILAPTLPRSGGAENVIAGNARSRRATYLFGGLLPAVPTGHVGAGLGQ